MTTQSKQKSTNIMALLQPYSKARKQKNIKTLGNRVAGKFNIPAQFKDV